MKLETLFLKVVIFLIGIPILGLCIFWLPWVANEVAEHYQVLVYLPIIICMYVATIPFFFALYQTLKILSYIDKNKAFSDLSVKALKYIEYCAITISILYAVCLPSLYIIADAEDAPGILVFGLIITSASFVIAVFGDVLQKQLVNNLKVGDGCIRE